MSEPSLSFSSLLSEHLHQTRDARIIGTKMAVVRPRCQLQLRCTDDTDVAEILPFLHALTSDGADLSPWHTLLLTHNIDTRLPPADVASVQCAPDGELDLDHLDADMAISSCSREQSYSPVQLLCRVLPLQTIRTIHVSIDTFGNDVPIYDWVDMLGRCAEVTSV